MCPSAEPVRVVALVDVTEPVLEGLLSVALHDADADDVAPPLGTAEGWDTERISWFRSYHNAAAGAGLVQAETTSGNAAALALLRTAGAELTTNGRQVTARFKLT
jgi:hypothetical protein